MAREGPEVAPTRARACAGARLWNLYTVFLADRGGRGAIARGPYRGPQASARTGSGRLDSCVVSLVVQHSHPLRSFAAGCTGFHPTTEGPWRCLDSVRLRVLEQPVHGLADGSIGPRAGRAEVLLDPFASRLGALDRHDDGRKTHTLRSTEWPKGVSIGGRVGERGCASRLEPRCETGIHKPREPRMGDPLRALRSFGECEAVDRSDRPQRLRILSEQHRWVQFGQRLPSPGHERLRAPLPQTNPSHTHPINQRPKPGTMEPRNHSEPVLVLSVLVDLRSRCRVLLLKSWFRGSRSMKT